MTLSTDIIKLEIRVLCACGAVLQNTPCIKIAKILYCRDCKRIYELKLAQLNPGKPLTLEMK